MTDKLLLDETIRWSSYRKANTRFPRVREAEITELLRRADVQPGETVLEIGTGNGFATFPLARAVEQGKVYTFDVVHDNLMSVVLRNDCCLPIVPVPQSLDYKFPLPAESVDRIVTTATFHHYDDRSKGTGTSGRQRVLKEFHRLLKPGAKLILADIANGTFTQRYFDAIDNPRYCAPRGHPHDFPDEAEVLQLCANAGFQDSTFQLVETPLRFMDEAEATNFMYTVHNAQCSPDESLELAKKYLSYRKTVDGAELGWNLFYLVARKK